MVETSLIALFVAVTNPKPKVEPPKPVVVHTPAPKPQPVKVVPTKKPQAAVSFSSGDGVWDRLAKCEAGGNWAANTGNGYYGGLQFNLSTWQSNGGTGYPHQASRAEQIRVAEKLRAARGFSPWPSCSKKLGLQ